MARTLLLRTHQPITQMLNLIPTLSDKRSTDNSGSAIVSQSQAWKEQCQKLELEKVELEQVKMRQETELEELRSVVAQMRDSFSKQNRLRENMAATESVDFSQLRDALGNTDKSNPILQTVFYLLNRRLVEMERATESDFSNGLKMAFENGRCSATRAIKEDLLGIIAEAGAEVKANVLFEARSPYTATDSSENQAAG